MKKYFTTVMMLLLVGTGIAHAQCNVSYGLSYAVYATESLSGLTGQVYETPGRGTVTISGSDRSVRGSCAVWQNYPVLHCVSYNYIYDFGTVSLTVNGYPVSTGYTRSSSSTSIATALASKLNGNANLIVAANSNVITIVAQTPGSATNYPLTISSSSSSHSFSGTSFPISSTTGSALAGGTDGNATGHILTSVVVDGSASMTGVQNGCPDSLYQQLLAEIAVAAHTPNVTNTVNNVGGSTNGSAVCATCYLSLQNDEDSGPVNVGQEVSFGYGGDISCSVGGLIYSISSGPFPVEIAFTYTKNNCTGTSTSPFYSCPTAGGPGDWPVTLWCAAEFSPPDYEPAISQNPQNWPFFLQIAPCIHLGVAGWFCDSLGPNWDGGLASNDASI